MQNKKKRILIGSSGASGMPLLLCCLELIRKAENYESHLIPTPSALLTLEHECGLKEKDLQKYADKIYSPEDIGASPASGSFLTEGMLVIPCSMKTLAGIQTGYTDNLLLRAADVTIKEQRRLILAVRESPLSAIHLRNMAQLALLPGVRIMPLMLTYYHCPRTLEDMTNQVAARLVEPFGIKSEEYHRWEGLKT